MYHFHKYQLDNLSFALYDLQGKLLKKQNVSNNATVIDLEFIGQGAYVLKVLEAQNELQTFKIIKN